MSSRGAESQNVLCFGTGVELRELNIMRLGLAHALRRFNETRFVRVSHALHLERVRAAQARELALISNNWLISRRGYQNRFRLCRRAAAACHLLEARWRCCCCTAVALGTAVRPRRRRVWVRRSTLCGGRRVWSTLCGTRLLVIALVFQLARRDSEAVAQLVALH